jgi:hypothetical protein
MKNDIRICVADFFTTHRHEPSGSGCWAFYFDSSVDFWIARNEKGNSYMTYAKALTLAKAEAKRRNAHVISVAP